jgi:hypothetical protein
MGLDHRPDNQPDQSALLAAAIETLANYGSSNEPIERALNDRGHQILLILARLAGFSWTSAKAILLLKCADRGIPAQDLGGAMHSYANLQAETARRVLAFYHSRLKRGASKAPVTASA